MRTNRLGWFMFLLCTSAAAQPSHGYVVGGVGTREGEATGQAAVGGERVGGKGLGLGAEAGFVTGHNSSAFGSGNVYYHLASGRGAGKADPFVTAGGGAAARLFDSGGTVNYGAGVNYWFARRLGLRLELRDLVVFADGSKHFWALRFGLSFH